MTKLGRANALLALLARTMAILVPRHLGRVHFVPPALTTTRLERHLYPGAHLALLARTMEILAPQQLSLVHVVLLAHTMTRLDRACVLFVLLVHTMIELEPPCRPLARLVPPDSSRIEAPPYVCLVLLEDLITRPLRRLKRRCIGPVDPLISSVHVKQDTPEATASTPIVMIVSKGCLWEQYYSCQIEICVNTRCISMPAILIRSRLRKTSS